MAGAAVIALVRSGVWASTIDRPMFVASNLLIACAEPADCGRVAGHRRTGARQGPLRETGAAFSCPLKPLDPQPGHDADPDMGALSSLPVINAKTRAVYDKALPRPARQCIHAS